MVTIRDQDFENINNYRNGTVDIFTNYIYINNDTFELYYDEITGSEFELCFDVEAFTGTKTIKIFDLNDYQNAYSISIGSIPKHIRIVSKMDNEIYVDGELVSTIPAYNSSGLGIEFGGHVIKNYSLTPINNTYVRLEGVVRWLKQWFYTKDEIDTNDSGWQPLTLSSGYEQYYANDNPLEIRKIGKFVEIRGMIKPTAQKTASTSAVQFAIVPSEYRPSYQFRSAICQGSGINRWHLTVETDGKLCWSRYGTTSSIAVPSGAWLCVHITYMVDS